MRGQLGAVVWKDRGQAIAAAEWVGMPEYDWGEEPLKIIVSFRDERDQAEFVRKLDLKLVGRGRTKSTWWPTKKKDDLSSLRFEG